MDPTGAETVKRVTGLNVYPPVLLGQNVRMFYLESREPDEVEASLRRANLMFPNDQNADMSLFYHGQVYNLIIEGDAYMEMEDLQGDI